MDKINDNSNRKNHDLNQKFINKLALLMFLFNMCLIFIFAIFHGSFSSFPVIKLFEFAFKDHTFISYIVVIFMASIVKIITKSTKFYFSRIYIITMIIPSIVIMFTTTLYFFKDIKYNDFSSKTYGFFILLIGSFISGIGDLIRERKTV